MIDLRDWPGFPGDRSQPALVSHVTVHSQDVRPGSLFVALKGQRVDGHDFVEEAFAKGASYALVSHGKGLVVEDPLRALQEIAAAYRKTLKAKVIAITGSFGKTQTKDLLAQLLSVRYRVTASPESYNSQIGVPLSLLRVKPDDDFAVIEVGVSHAGEMDMLIPIVDPDYAILTCIGAAHLRTMGSLEATEKEKRKLLASAKGWTIDQGEDQAVRAAKLCGLSEEEIAKGLEGGIPQPIRTDIWRSPYGATFVIDPPSSDPLSIEGALRMINQPAEKTIYVGEKPIAHANIDEAVEVKSLEDVSDLLRKHEGKPYALLLKSGEATADLAGDNRLMINLDRVRQNVEMLPPKRLMAILKANAYGTGSIEMAKFLKRCGVDSFGVAHVHEAINLRLAGVQEDLLVIHVAPYEAKQVTKWGLQPAVSDHALLDALDEATVHLHIDTGMSRFGCRPEEALELAKRIHKSPKLHLAGVMTHFASADNGEYTNWQIERFQKAIHEIEAAGIPIPWKHAQATGGLHYEIPECNMIRIGLGLFDNALTLTSRLASIREHLKGESVSYSNTYTVQRERERIGVIPLGYFDGIHRHYSNKGDVLIHGKKAPIVGTVCMDFLMVNLTDIPEANVHDPVTIFGEGASPEAFAKKGGTRVTELITCLGPRIQRVFRYEGTARELQKTL